MAQLVEALEYKTKGRGSIPDGVIGIFLSFNPSRSTVALMLSPHLSYISNRNISCEVKTAIA